jgi:hypothetical protein
MQRLFKDSNSLAMTAASGYLFLLISSLQAELLFLLSLKQTFVNRKIDVYENYSHWQNRDIMGKGGLWKMALPFTVVKV